MKARQQLVSFALIVVVSLVGSVGPASAVKQIEWENLLPKLPPLTDPLAGLNLEQRYDVETIQWARGLTEEQKRFVENQQGVRDAKMYEQQFRTAGLDVDELLEKYRSWLTAVAKREEQVNAQLNGQVVRLAGYLLPLEFSEHGTTDFLLVPYVGACIHVPPPPPNQIVFVRLAKKFRVQELFASVWISGKLKTQVTSKALTLIDGTADIPVGYHIDGGSAEAYRE